MKLDMEPLDLAKTLAESLRVVSGRAQDKRLVLDADIEGNIPIVADRRATKQIMVNLLSNAVKFTPEGGRVTMRSRVFDDKVVLIIADTGIGIPAQSLARLGRPFEQVESQMTKTYHGSGLGLAIAREYVARYAGTIALDTRPGGGTRASLRLPIASLG
jgi:two-component system cell cycle sensor histidine kinase PleC